MNKKRRGLFLVLEGIDGAGTTTQAKAVSEWLKRLGYQVHLTSEPSDGPIGTFIRRILKGDVVSQLPDGTQQDIGSDTLALLFAADRINHIQSEIAPLLQQGCHVICDRYVLSSLAYQGVGSETDFVKEVNTHALTADLTIFLRVPADVAMDRVTRRQMERDAFENLSFQEKVARSYEEVMDQYKEGGKLILDGESSVESITSEIRRAVESLLDESGSSGPS
jgi:dTMP kinase